MIRRTRFHLVTTTLLLLALYIAGSRCTVQLPRLSLLEAEGGEQWSKILLRLKALRFGRTVKEMRKVSDLLSKVELIAESEHLDDGPISTSRNVTGKTPSFYHDTNARLHDYAGPLKALHINYLKWKPDKTVQAGRFTDDSADADLTWGDDPAPTSAIRRSFGSANPAEQDHHKFEGDIVLFEDQAEAVYETAAHSKDRRRKRKFIGPTARRWNASEPILYNFDGSHTGREQRIIELALEHWHNITCLNFERRTDEPSGNRLVFTNVDGCASNVGRHPLGEPQFISLAPECMRLGVIAHEVGHALGFWHEQSRPDRDNFVDVQWNNIDLDSKGQFLKEEPNDVDSSAIPYDYGSIMHYRSKAFAKYDDLFTIRTFIPDYQRTIGQRDQLAFNDIRLMNNIYCKKACSNEIICKRGGYTDPRLCDRCRCPDGFTGKYCERVMSGYISHCGGTVHLEVGRWTTISTPQYPNSFKEGSECSWLLKAPRGLRVQLQFVGSFELYCKASHSLCMDYVEVRNGSSFANTGMRHCCYTTPRGSTYSATEELMLLFRSFYRSGVGFQARARAIRATGEWSPWGRWSACSASCGACGVQTRSRTCQSDTICDGDSKRMKPCNRNPCDVCPHTKYTTAPCGGFLGLLRGVRCKTEKTVYGPCPNACCPGFVLNRGICLDV